MSRELAKELHERRGRLIEQMRAMTDRWEKQGYITAEDDRQRAAMDVEVVELGKRVDQLLTDAEQTEDLEHQRERFTDLLAPSAGPEDDSGAWIRAWLDGEGPAKRVADFRGVKATRDEHGRTTVETHDLTKGVTTAGGFTVPADFLERLYEHMVAGSGVRLAGATVVTTEDGRSLPVPKTTAHSAAGIVAEGALIPESDPAFGQASLAAYKYAFVVQVTRELIEDTAVDLSGYLARQTGLAIGLGSGAHFATGTGTGQPLGVGGTGTPPTVGKVGATGQTTTVKGEDLIDLLHSVVGGYRANGSWIMKDSTLASVRKLRDEAGGVGTGQFLWQPGLQAGAPDTLLGRPVYTDVAFPAMGANAFSIAFGDFGVYYIIRDVVGIRFDRSDDFAFQNDLASFRALLRTDGTRLISGTDAAVKFYQNSAT